MNGKNRLLMRVAVEIQEQLKSQQAVATNIELPTSTWQECERLICRRRLALQKGWYLAAERLLADLRRVVSQLQGDLMRVNSVLEPRRINPRDAACSDIYADLVEIDQEFTEVSCDRQKQTISVTTEPIELEEIFLGPFEIRLNWKNLAEGLSHNYRVIALDPHPAASNDGVTHPHVQDEAVCEGDGHQSIHNALKQVRLLDFFVIVANLLQTYNSESPYVSLSEWYGQQCADCGTTVCDDERWSCEKCGTIICGDCYYHCSDCEDCFCSECVVRCEECDEYHCAGCTKFCSRCHIEICQGCLNENERCTDCHVQETQEKNDQPDDCEEPGGRQTTDTPLQPDRLGEATVSS